MVEFEPNQGIVPSLEFGEKHEVKTCAYEECRRTYIIAAQGQATHHPAVHVDTEVGEGGRIITGKRQNFCSVECLNKYMGWPYP